MTGTPLRDSTPLDDDAQPSGGGVVARLSAWDAASIIIGIVVGTAIFKTLQMIFSNAGGPWQALGLWALGRRAFVGRRTLLRRVGDNLPALRRRLRISGARIRPGPRDSCLDGPS